MNLEIRLFFCKQGKQEKRDKNWQGMGRYMLGINFKQGKQRKQRKQDVKELGMGR